MIFLILLSWWIEGWITKGGISAPAPEFRYLIDWDKYAGNPIIDTTEYAGNGYWPCACYDPNQGTEGPWFLLNQSNAWDNTMELYVGDSLHNIAEHGSSPVHDFNQAWEDGGFEPHSLWWDESGSEWRLYYCSRPAGTGWDKGKIGLATSSDLINWVEYGGNPILYHPDSANYGYADPLVIKRGKFFYLFVVRYGAGGNPVYMYFSPDGIANWNYIGKIIGSGEWGDYLLNIGNVFTGLSNGPTAIGWYAESIVGVDTVSASYSGNPVISRVLGTWEDHSLGQCSPLYTKDGLGGLNNGYYIFYWAKGPSNKLQLGYATTQTIKEE